MSSEFLYNTWFLEAAPKAYRDTRAQAIADVKSAMAACNEMRTLTPALLRASPGVLPTLRMSTAPPIARDRLSGLADVPKSLIKTLEAGGLPKRMKTSDLARHLTAICDMVVELLDLDLFAWLADGHDPSEDETVLAATVVADRLCGSVADPIIRNAQERRQLAVIAEWLTSRGYVKQQPPAGKDFTHMAPGTFSFRLNVPAGSPDHTVNIPVDAVIQPKTRTESGYPLLFEAKSAGDFTNVNKRRKEEATKLRQLRERYGDSISLTLFLCGYFDAGYLGYEAAEGLDWVWEHRTDDLALAGL
jgi:hypothetical protein